MAPAPGWGVQRLLLAAGLGLAAAMVLTRR
jgi:hypothetical protein